MKIPLNGLAVESGHTNWMSDYFVETPEEDEGVFMSNSSLMPLHL
jgi:hypothetical protein